MTRSAALGSSVLSLVLCVVACAQTPPPPATPPATPTPPAPEAKSELEFAKLDPVVEKFMAKIKATNGTIAVSKGGAIVYKHGYGKIDSLPTPPDTLLRIASITKPLTMALVRRAFLDGKIKPEEKMLDILQPKFKTTFKLGDDRLKDITVQHLLDHKGGWDSSKGGDPMFQTRKIEAGFRPKRAATPQDVAEYGLSKPLEYPPGTRVIYSNFGYCLLGRILEARYGKTYFELIQEAIAEPLKITDLKMGRTAKADRDPREPAYPVNDSDFRLEVMDSDSGLIASASAVCQFLEAYWLDGKKRKATEWGDWAFFGTLPGTTSLARQRKDGYTVVVLLNARLEATRDKDNAVLLKELDKAFEGIVAAMPEEKDKK